MIVYAQHPRTKAQRCMSIPLNKREYHAFTRDKNTFNSKLTEDQISFIRTGLLIKED